MLPQPVLRFKFIILQVNSQQLYKQLNVKQFVRQRMYTPAQLHHVVETIS